MGPTLAGFIAWAQGAMGITNTILPSTSPFYVYAYNVAIELVNQALQCASPTIYTLAVYNLAGSNLINFAPDAPGAADVPGSVPPLPFFAYSRMKYNCLGFVSGVVSSTGDEGTNMSLVVQEAAKNFTLANLQQLKDPWGRQYLAFAQSYGPSVWGIS